VKIDDDFMGCITMGGLVLAALGCMIGPLVVWGLL
jgi:hypothetical protein